MGKNIETRATLDKTWRAGESYPDADVDKQIMQYSYIDGDDHVFMNMASYEEERIPTANLDKAEFITDVQMPATMNFRVTEAQPATAGAGKDKLSKMVEIETGYIISVPQFIKEGDLIKIDTDKREYLGRDTKGKGKGLA